MEKLLESSVEKRSALVFQQNTSVLDNEPLSFFKKVWFQMVGEASLLLYFFHQKQQLKYRGIVEKLQHDSSIPLNSISHRSNCFFQAFRKLKK